MWGWGPTPETGRKTLGWVFGAALRQGLRIFQAADARSSFGDMPLAPGHEAAAIFPWPVSAVAEWGGRQLRAWRPDWDTQRPSSSNPPSWFISPEQTFVECAFWIVAFWVVLIWLIRGPGLKTLGLPRAGSRRKITTSDKTIAAVVTASLLIIVWYKYVTGTFVYLTQPCHLVIPHTVSLQLCRLDRQSAHTKGQEADCISSKRRASTLAVFLSDFYSY